jgi:cytochrome P450
VHVAIPNGMDPPEHGLFRAIVDRYFTPELMAAFEPVCRGIVVELVDELVDRGGGEVMAALAEPFAVRAQCAFMGWPDALRATLLDWQEANRRATRARDRAGDGRPLTDAEIIGIVRTWTVGARGSSSA